MSNRPSKKPMPSAKRANEARAQAARNRTIWIVAAVAVAVVFALVLAIVASGGGDDDTTAANKAESTIPVGSDDPAAITYGTVEVEGSPLAPLTPGTDSEVGQPVPAITGQLFNGEPITIGGSTSGKPTVILGVAHWCPHCQKEVPIIQKWLDENGTPTDVDLVAISTSAEPAKGNWPANEWLAGDGWTVPTLVDDKAGTAASAIGLSGFPFMVVVDADGNVVYRTSGEKTVQQWEAIVEAARTGVPPTA